MSEKEAYIWLTDCFIRAYPEILNGPGWKRDLVGKGRSVMYFAKDPKSLFPQSPHLSDDNEKYARLGDGWFANLVLSNEQKSTILHRFANLAGLRYGVDWKWEVQGQKFSDSDRALRDF